MTVTHRKTSHLQGAGAFLFVLAFGAQARADQFIVTDVTYMHSAQNTTDSHFRVAPSKETPKDWTAPVDWTKGTAHVLLEVKSKPKGDTPTKFQVCFEGTPSYACTDQSPTYTTTGKYEWTTAVKNFWSPADAPMQWKNGVNKVALILKDTNNGKPQGDPKYVPTDLHVEVAIVSEGAKYQPPSAGAADAGTSDAGKTADAGASANDAGGGEPDTADGGEEEPRSDASASATPRDAGLSAPRDSGSAALGDASAAESSDANSAKPGSAGNDSGCAVGGGWSDGYLALLAFAWLRRRAARPRARS